MVSKLPASVWAAARRDLFTVFGCIESAEVRRSPSGLLGITGGPTADFNMALIDAGADDEAMLRQFEESVTKSALPAVFMLSSACAERLGQIAKQRGLVEAGTAPLMLLADGPPFPREPGFAVQRVNNEKALTVVADLVAAAFALDRDWVGRTFCARALLEAPPLSFFLASKEGEPYSAVTTTAGSSTVGIWSMATSPDRQRQGAGRAALLGAIEHHRDLGATTFYLIATPAGKPLYDSVGFTTVDEFPIWVSRGSESSAAH
jgi:N-acetylglutamate synthase